MQVQVLCFEGCPNHQPTVQLAQDVIRDLGLTVAVEEVEVTSLEDAERLRFLGSPTVLVNGVDIEPSARSSTAHAFACRTYGSAGTPPQELLVAALTSAAGIAAPQPSSSAVLESEQPQEPSLHPLAVVGGVGRGDSDGLSRVETLK